MSDEKNEAGSGNRTLSRGRVAAFGLLLFLDFIVVVVMLATDKNLQTDFGSLSSGYYSHWYGLLAEGILDLIIAAAVLSTVSLGALKRRSLSNRKYVVIGGLLWTILAIVAMLAIVETWSQVGFQNMSQFSQYLFGVTAYKDVKPYIPWLYDLLLGMYILTALAGVVATRTVPADSK
jgi:hypothetical protein